MFAGAVQTIVGAAFPTVIATVAVAVVKLAASVGVNVADSTCAAPALRTVPAAGVYTNVPGTLAVAFNCEAPSGVPNVIAAGALHVIVGVAFPTVIATLAVAVAKLTTSVGVKVTDNVCAAPALRTVPAAGVYTNVPGTLAVAFNCVAPSGVPNVIAAGALHVIVGVAFPTVIATLAVAVAKLTTSVGVKVTDNVCAAPALRTVPADGV